MEKTLYIPIEYHLENYHRSNQDTCLVHRPIIKEGNWVQPGDLLADSSSSKNGELSIGQNILIAYMPWEGYNYEDAMLISDRLVYDELYTSIHIERYDIAIEDTPFGLEKITNEISDLPGETLIQLDKNGIVRLGSSVKEGDILVGKVTPTDKKVKYSNYEKLLYDILGTKKQNKGKDTSLRVPKGLEATVINIEIFSENLSFSLTNLNILSFRNPLIYIQKGVLKLLNLQTKKNLKPNNNLLKFKNKFIKIYSIPTLASEAKVLCAKRSINFYKFIETIMLNSSNRLPISLYLNSNKNLSIALNSTKFIILPRSYYPFSQVIRNSNYKSISNVININSKLARIKNRIKKTIRDMKLVSKQNLTKLKSQYCLSYFEIFLFELLICARKKKHLFLIKKIINSVFRYTLYDLNLERSEKNNFSLTKPNNNNFSETKKTKSRAKLHFKKIRKKKSKKIYSINKYETQLEKDKLTQKKIFSLNVLNSKSFRIQVYLAEKRKIQVGDKIAGRHGNKGIISQILPIQDMPYLGDGSTVDLVLNPLGVPSRMNVGQIYECLLGLAGSYLGEYYRILPFDEKVGEEASRSFVFSKLYEARLKTEYSWLFDPKNPGKTYLFDGRTGEKFEQQVTVGYAYILKLVHLVDDKIHCLTSDHEVLTHFGWKKINKINYMDKIATLKKGFLIYQYPKNILFYPDYSGKIYQLSTNSIDFNITINHRIWASEYNFDLQSWSDFQLREVCLLTGKIVQYKKIAKWIYKNYKFLHSNLHSVVLIESLKKINEKILSFFIMQLQKVSCPKSKKNKNNHLKVIFFRKSSFWKLFLWIIKTVWQKSFSVDIFLIFLTTWKNHLIFPSSQKYQKNHLDNIYNFTKNKHLTHLKSIISTISNRNCLNFLFKYKTTQTKSLNIIKSKKKFKFFCTKIVYFIQTKKNQRISRIIKESDNFKKFYYLIKILIKYLIYKVPQKNNKKSNFQQNYQNNFFPFWIWLLNKRQCRIYLNSFLISNCFEIKKNFYSLIFFNSLADELIRIILHAEWNSNFFILPHFLIIEIKKLFCNKNKKILNFNKKKLKGLSFFKKKPNSSDSNLVLKLKFENLKIKRDLRLSHVYKNQIFINVRQKVYCLKISSAIFFIRHNGKMVWTGNSRSTGPYSAVTQQPLRGRSKQGGQRLGEMEVWALEGYGAAFTLLELLTIKSDDKIGRLTIWDSILRQKEISIKTPESFKVLICELKALCFDINIFRKNK